MRRWAWLAGGLLFAALLLAVVAERSPMAKPPELGLRDGALAACPSTPNCVRSDDSAGGGPDAADRPVDRQRAADDERQPLRFDGPADRAWQALLEVLRTLPRTKIVDRQDRYVRAECTSLLLRFVDDLEFHLPEGQSAIQFRSASRVGYSDLGANARRIREIRRRWQQAMR